MGNMCLAASQLPLKPVASILGKHIFMRGSTSQTSGPSPWGTHGYGLELHESKDETESCVTGKVCCVCVQRATQNRAEEGVHRPGLQHRGWRRGGGHLCLLHTGRGASRPQWRVETRRQDLVCEYMHALGFIIACGPQFRSILELLCWLPYPFTAPYCIFPVFHLSSFVSGSVNVTQLCLLINPAPHECI